jgi:hypothetical protein
MIMGTYGPHIDIKVSLSRHNSRNDEIDNLLYEEMTERIERIIKDPQYNRIEPTLLTHGIDWPTHVERAKGQ